MGWSEQRFRELADAEAEALDGTGGLLACSPEIWVAMNTVYTVIVGGDDSEVEIDSVWWDQGEAESALGILLSEGKAAYIRTAVFSPPKAKPRTKKFSEMLEQENRVFYGEHENSHFFLDGKGGR